MYFVVYFAHGFFSMCAIIARGTAVKNRMQQPIEINSLPANAGLHIDGEMYNTPLDRHRISPKVE
jgi:hypothetical protein